MREGEREKLPWQLKSSRCRWSPRCCRAFWEMRYPVRLSIGKWRLSGSWSNSEDIGFLSLCPRQNISHAQKIVIKEAKGRAFTCALDEIIYAQGNPKLGNLVRVPNHILNDLFSNGLLVGSLILVRAADRFVAVAHNSKPIVDNLQTITVSMPSSILLPSTCLDTLVAPKKNLSRSIIWLMHGPRLAQPILPEQNLRKGSRWSRMFARLSSNIVLRRMPGVAKARRQREPDTGLIAGRATTDELHGDRKRV